MAHMSHPLLNSRLRLVLAVAGLMAACVAPPPRRGVVAPPPPPPPPPRLIVYPAHGQSQQQLEQDRYACHVWAVQQSGFDPSAASGAPPPPRTVVEPSTPPGAGTAVGAIAGAVLGAALAGPRDAGLGLVFGGLTGAAVGSARDANAQAQANAEQAHLDQRYAAYAAQHAEGFNNYRRAIAACLDARGYTIA